jgi:hypothetical protein
MSTLNTTNIKHPSSASNNIVLDSSGRALVGVSSANANGGILQLSSGITFPATQVLSTDPNTLDDYEEGTWTPELADANTGGNTFTHSVQQGFYTKVGNVVTTYFRVTWTSKGSASGLIRMRGFPFQAKSNTGSFYYTAAIVPSNGQTTLGIEGGSTLVGIFWDTSGGNGTAAEFSASDTGVGINGSLTYIAN